MHLGGCTFFLHQCSFKRHIIHLLWATWESMVIGRFPQFSWDMEFISMSFQQQSCELNTCVHQAHKNFYAWWGRLKVFWPYIEELHKLLQGTSQFWFCIGSVDLLVWWCDFHILIFIFYEDKNKIVNVNVWKDVDKIMGPWNSLEWNISKWGSNFWILV